MSELLLAVQERVAKEVDVSIVTNSESRLITRGEIFWEKLDQVACKCCLCMNIVF